MANFRTMATDTLKDIIMSALAALVAKGKAPSVPLPAFTVEYKISGNNGDVSTNVCLASAKTLSMPPMKVAEMLSEEIFLPEGGVFSGFAIAPPGFMNFTLSDNFFSEVLRGIFDEGEDYGKASFGGGKRVMVEFVSANPTGTMHLGNARGGALGDSLASALLLAGYDVTREFYVNDYGNQIDRFASSLRVRYLQIINGADSIDMPEDGYHGEDVTERANEFYREYGESPALMHEDELRGKLIQFALPRNINSMREHLAEYRITFDNWFLESSLHESGEVARICDILTKNGKTYEKDGALFYKTGDKDEVLIRANGTPTYFAADIAYHYNKFVTRGFYRVIDIWGADHHGHVARLCGALDDLGVDSSKLRVVLMQLVRLLRGGEVVKMSKRSGKAITLSTLTGEVSVPAARFFFNLNSPDVGIDFDLDLAVSQTKENPVYYVCYAHARICSIIAGLGVGARQCGKDEIALLTTSYERELIKQLAQFTHVIIECARAYDTSGLTRYLIDLSSMFHKFYSECRIKGESEAVMSARLLLCHAVKSVLKTGLGVLKVEAPEQM